MVIKFKGCFFKRQLMHIDKNTCDSNSLVLSFQWADIILITSFSLAISSSLTIKSLLILSKFLGETSSSNSFLSSQSLFAPVCSTACTISCSILKTPSLSLWPLGFYIFQGLCSRRSYILLLVLTIILIPILIDVYSIYINYSRIHLVMLGTKINNWSTK